MTAYAVGSVQKVRRFKGRAEPDVKPIHTKRFAQLSKRFGSRKNKLRCNVCRSYIDVTSINITCKYIFIENIIISLLWYARTVSYMMSAIRDRKFSLSIAFHRAIYYMRTNLSTIDILRDHAKQMGYGSGTGLHLCAIALRSVGPIFPELSVGAKQIFSARRISKSLHLNSHRDNSRRSFFCLAESVEAVWAIFWNTIART